MTNEVMNRVKSDLETLLDVNDDYKYYSDGMLWSCYSIFLIWLQQNDVDFTEL